MEPGASSCSARNREVLEREHTHAVMGYVYLMGACAWDMSQLRIKGGTI